MDQLETWGCVEVLQCVLYRAEDNTYCKGKQEKAEYIELHWLQYVLHLSREERKNFQKITRTPRMLAKQIVQEVHMRER